jgi:hypothetical protein
MHSAMYLLTFPSLFPTDAYIPADPGGHFGPHGYWDGVVGLSHSMLLVD